jgi:hypothetical protein
MVERVFLMRNDLYQGSRLSGCHFFVSNTSRHDHKQQPARIIIKQLIELWCPSQRRFESRDFQLYILMLYGLALDKNVVPSCRMAAS